MVSAAFGTLFGTVVDQVLPGADIAPGAFALVAMAATFGASTRATFAAIVFVFELTRDYDVIVPLMLATVLAGLVFDALSEHSIMTEKLHGRGLRIGRHYGVDPLSTSLVGQIMSAPVATLPSTTTVADARDRFVTGGHGAYPIVDSEGGVAGIVTRGDVLGDEARPDDSVLEVASRDVVSVTPDAPAVVAMNLMIDESIEHVPVIADGRLLGICTRTDLLKVSHVQREHERPQDGLAHAVLRTRPGAPAPGASTEQRQKAAHRRIPVVQKVLERLQAEAPAAAGVDLGPGQRPRQLVERFGVVTAASDDEQLAARSHERAEGRDPGCPQRAGRHGLDRVGLEHEVEGARSTPPAAPADRRPRTRRRCPGTSYGRVGRRRLDRSNPTTSNPSPARASASSPAPHPTTSARRPVRRRRARRSIAGGGNWARRRPTG